MADSKADKNEEKETGETQTGDAFKTYKEICEIISDELGVDDPESISEKDLDELVKLAGKKLTEADIKLFNTVRKKNKMYKMLAVPELPKTKTLTAPDLQKIESLELDQRLKVFKGEIDKKAQAPIDFSSMTAAEWVKVILNCNMTYGRVFRKLGSPDDRAEQPLFFPPNERLFGTPDFMVSQVALSFSQKSEKLENFSDKSVMANLTVGSSFSTPWVAGSAEYSHETKNRSVNKDSTIKSVFKVEVPIGIFTLPHPSELENSKIKLNDDFRSFINKYLEEHPDCTKQKVQRAITQRFGDIVPRSVKIGVACYTTQTTKLEESQSLEAVSDSFAASVTGSYGLFSAGGQTSGGKSTSDEKGSKSQKNTYAFSAIAGSLPDPNNPMSVADYRVLPNSWRIIDFGNEFTPVFEYLGEDVKKRLEGLPNEVVQESFRFVEAKASDHVPENAVSGGFDGGWSYHARASVKDLLIPGKVGVDSSGRLVTACIPYGGDEHRVESFQIVTSTTKLNYHEAKKGDKPPLNAIVGGYDGGNSYFAKGIVDDVTIPGKVGIDQNGKFVGACIPYGGKEHRIDTFWVLLNE